MRALRRVGRAMLALALAVPASTLVGTPANAAPAPLVGVASNRCLDVAGGTSANGALVDIWDCNGQSNQGWEFTAAGELRVFNGGRCLDVPNASTTPGVRLAIWDCNGGANQKFRLNSNGSITATQSGLCLDVHNQATANGTAVTLWNCNGQANQQWRAGTNPGPGPACSVNPVNPNATAQARKLLCYVYSQYGNHILSGQQESTWIGGPDYEIDYSGTTPASTRRSGRWTTATPRTTPRAPSRGGTPAASRWSATTWARRPSRTRTRARRWRCPSTRC